MPFNSCAFQLVLPFNSCAFQLVCLSTRASRYEAAPTDVDVNAGVQWLDENVFAPQAGGRAAVPKSFDAQLGLTRELERRLVFQKH